MFTVLTVTPTPNLTTLLSSVADVVTAIIGWVGNACTTVTSNPFLLLGVGFFVIGGSIGITGRLIKKS